MARKPTLRRRIIVAFFLLTLVVCGIFSSVVYLVLHNIETKLYSQYTVQVGDWLIDRESRGELSTEDSPKNIRIYKVDYGQTEKLPYYLRDLQPGFHEIEVPEAFVHVYVREFGDQVYYIASDQSDFEKSEFHIAIALIAGIMFCLIASLWLGRFTAGTVIAPVTRLAREVQASNDSVDVEKYSDDEVGALASAFDQRLAQLNRFLIRERSFTGDVSHELRTPLAVILGASEVLISRERDPGYLEAAERIRRSAEKMAKLVDLFLLLSREQLQLDAEPCSINSIIANEIDRHRKILDDKPVVVSLVEDAQLVITAHPVLVSTLLGNLVANAFNYTDKGKVQITVGENSCSVRDTGTGVPEHIGEMIFNRSVRADPRGTRGTGLGLAIAKRICEHYGWRISYERPIPAGSLFRIAFT